MENTQRLLNKLQIEFESMVNGIQEIASFVAQCYSSKILISNGTHIYIKMYIYTYCAHCTVYICTEIWRSRPRKMNSMLSPRSLVHSLFLTLPFSIFIARVPCYHHHFELHISQIIYRQQQHSTKKNNKYIILLRWTNDFLLEQKHDCIQIVFVCKCKGGRARVHTQRYHFFTIRPLNVHTISMWRKNTSIHI